MAYVYQLIYPYLLPEIRYKLINPDGLYAKDSFPKIEIPQHLKNALPKEDVMNAKFTYPIPSSFAAQGRNEKSRPCEAGQKVMKKGWGNRPKGVRQKSRPKAKSNEKSRAKFFPARKIFWGS